MAVSFFFPNEMKFAIDLLEIALMLAKWGCWGRLRMEMVFKKLSPSWASVIKVRGQFISFIALLVDI